MADLAAIPPDLAPVSKPGKTGKPAGDNPNKAKAQGRQNYRPQRKNVVDSTFDQFASKISFAEPVQLSYEPSPAGGLTVTEHQEYAGEVDIRLKSISEISYVFADATVALGDVTDVFSATKGAYTIAAGSMLAAARNIYAAAPASQKSLLTRYKGVYYFDVPLPDALGPIVTIFGEFRSKIGTIKLAHSVQRFMQLTLAATGVIERISGGSPTAYNAWDRDPITTIVDEANTTVFDLDGFVEFARHLASAEFTTLSDREYQIAGTQFVAKARRIAAAETRDDYLQYLNDSGYGADAPILASLAVLFRDNVAYAWLADPAQDAMRNRVGVRIPRPDDTGHALTERFYQVQVFIEQNRNFLGKLWKVDVAPVPGKGFAAQLVKRRRPADKFMAETDMFTPVGMSDYDFEVGHMLAPAENVKLYPDLQVYTPQPRLKTAAGYADKATVRK